MRIRFLISFLLVLSVFQGHSQNQPTIYTSNYSGVLGVHGNPANIADNRYMLDINLATVNWSFYNNYIALKDKSLGWYLNNTPWQSFVPDDTTSTVWQDPEFHNKYLIERLDDQNKSIHGYVEAMLPSVLFTIDEKNALAVTWRIRSIINVDGLSPELSKLIYNDFDVPDLFTNINIPNLLNNPHMGIANMTWAEYSFGYGRVIYDKHKHFLKMGVNVKLTQGMHAMYMQVEGFDYEVLNQDTLVNILQRRVNYGRSERYDPFDGEEFAQYKFDSKIAPAFDFGIIYEYRPNREKYKYDMDGEYDLWMNDKNKYKWKFGLSVTDIGRIKFNKAASSHDFLAALDTFDIGSLDPKSMQDVDHIIDSSFSSAPNDDRTFNMNLPTALSLEIDYNIWNDFYLNFRPYWALYSKTNATKVHNISSYTLTPRYDHRWVGVMVPISYNHYGNTSVGLALRLGPLTIGTTDFIPYVSAVSIYGIDGYFSVRVPIFRKGKPDDRDDDKVSDKTDDCPEIPGDPIYNGCPDIDNDGIPDILDDCPSDSGVAEFKGCPDTDGDGIIDKYDECIDLPGVLAWRGCPDTDGDSLIDPQDSCPTVAGPKFFHGCPDTDGDSIVDPQDLCPEHPGPKENGGCPDRDKDGIFDFLDDCPEEAGPEENNGCPWPDTDGDGILDKDDRCPRNPGPVANDGCPYVDTDGDSILDKDDDCPNVPGVPENNGCPKIEKEDQDIINTAFDNLEFLSGKAVIRDESFSSLDELAGLLTRKPDWKLNLAGHTDNVGSEKNNLILSKLRAESVQKYLVDKGVEKERINVEFFGETAPIESNDTPEGRQKNRRVEMEIRFE